MLFHVEPPLSVSSPKRPSNTQWAQCGKWCTNAHYFLMQWCTNVPEEVQTQRLTRVHTQTGLILYLRLLTWKGIKDFLGIKDQNVEMQLQLHDKILIYRCSTQSYCMISNSYLFIVSCQKLCKSFSETR